MNSKAISGIALAALAIVATGPANAQVYPVQPPSVQAPVQGQQPGYPQGCPAQVTPSGQMLYDRFMRRFASFGLMPQQQQQIESLVDGFSRVHPAGSPLDPTAMHQLRDQVRGVLTPQQVALLQQQHRERPPMQHRCP